MSEPDISEYRMYDYMVEHLKTNVRDIDFKTELTHRLTKRTTMVGGAPTACVYYSDDTYTTEICRIDYVFHRDSLGLLTKKEMTLKWYLKTGELSSVTKDLSKYYDPVYDAAYRISENRLMRDNNTKNCLLGVQGYLVQVKGVSIMQSLASGIQFIRTHKAEIDDYVETGDVEKLKRVIDTTPLVWFEFDVKEYAKSLL